MFTWRVSDGTNTRKERYQPGEKNLLFFLVPQKIWDRVGVKTLIYVSLINSADKRVPHIVLTVREVWDKPRILKNVRWFMC